MPPSHSRRMRNKKALGDDKKEIARNILDNDSITTKGWVTWRNYLGGVDKDIGFSCNPPK